MEYGSRKIKWYWLLLFVVFCGFSVYRLFQGNPYLYSHAELRSALSKIADRPRQTIPKHPQVATKLSGPTYLARYNLERSAVDPIGTPRSRSYVETQSYPVDFAAPGFEPTNFVSDHSGFYLSGKNAWVIAVSLEGDVRWRYHFLDQGLEHPIPTVLLDSEYAYLIHPAGEVVCLSKSTGEFRWLMDLHQNVAAAPFIWTKNIMVPVRTGDRMQIVPVRRSDGSVEPTTPKFEAKQDLLLSFSTELEAFIGTYDNKVVALDPEDWDVMWTQTLTDPIRGPAMINDQQIYVSTLGGKIVRLDGSKKGKIDWESDLPKAPLSPPTYLPIMRKLSVLDMAGYLNALDMKTGKQLWREPTDTKAGGLNETWSARLKGRNIEEFKMDWLHKGWSIWSPCGEHRLCIYAPNKGQLIERIQLRGTPLALPLASEKGWSVFTQVKAGSFAISKLVEEGDARKNKSAE